MGMFECMVFPFSLMHFDEGRPQMSFLKTSSNCFLIAMPLKLLRRNISIKIKIVLCLLGWSHRQSSTRKDRSCIKIIHMHTNTKIYLTFTVLKRNTWPAFGFLGGTVIMLMFSGFFSIRRHSLVVR